MGEFKLINWTELPHVFSKIAQNYTLLVFLIDIHIAPQSAVFIKKLYTSVDDDDVKREWNSESERIRLKNFFIDSLSMTIAKQRVRDIRALCDTPHALHTYNTTPVPNDNMPDDNTHDMPNEGRAILRNGEAGLR